MFAITTFGNLDARRARYARGSAAFDGSTIERTSSLGPNVQDQQFGPSIGCELRRVLDGKVCRRGGVGSHQDRRHRRSAPSCDRPASNIGPAGLGTTPRPPQLRRVQPPAGTVAFSPGSLTAPRCDHPRDGTGTTRSIGHGSAAERRRPSPSPSSPSAWRARRSRSRSRSRTRRRRRDSTVIIVGDRTAPRVASIAAEIAGNDFTRTGPGVAGIVITSLFCFVWLGVGTLIVSRQPTNWAGWIFIAVGMPLLVLALCQAVLVYGLRTEPGSAPFMTAWALLGENALYPVVLIPLLFLLYPDGHVPESAVAMGGARADRWDRDRVPGIRRSPGTPEQLDRGRDPVRQSVGRRRLRRCRRRHHRGGRDHRPGLRALDGGRRLPALQAIDRGAAPADAGARVRRRGRRDHVGAADRDRTRRDLVVPR